MCGAIKVQRDWRSGKQWSDRFLPEIKSILGQHLIAEPPIEEDAERNTDLMVLRLDAVRIGCRIRRHEYLAPYGHQFTIRAGVPSGAKTEITKVIEGWGNYFFYGFSDEAEQALKQWVLCDLNVFRLSHARMLAACKPGEAPGDIRTNSDGTKLTAFNLSDFPTDLVVAQSRRPIFARSA